MGYINSIPKPKIYPTHYSPKTMKHYAWLISRKLLGDKCSSCNKDLFKKFKKHTHHINKNIWDNRLKNLKILCPKCHFKEEYPNGRTVWFKGKNHSERTKEILRQKALGRKLSEETKLKISKSVSISQKKRWNRIRKEKPELIKQFSDLMSRNRRLGIVKTWNKGIKIVGGDK